MTVEPMELMMSLCHNLAVFKDSFSNGLVIVVIILQEKDSKLSELESENRKMKVELEEFRTEATHLKNQQATIRRLEERTRQLEQQVGIFLYNVAYVPFYAFCSKTCIGLF